MNTQELFNTIVSHCLAQNAKSIKYISGDDRDVPVCMYRSPTGKKCAIGAVISDSAYDPKLEGRILSFTLKGLVNTAIEESIGRKIEDHELRLLETCQFVHDSSDVLDWHSRFSDVADEFNLTMPGEVNITA